MAGFPGCSMSKQNPEFITVQEAVARGYGSRAALCKWIKNGQVRTYMDDAQRRRYVCAEDCEDRVAARQSRYVPPITESEIVERLAKQIAAAAPALSDASKSELAALLRECE